LLAVCSIAVLSSNPARAQSVNLTVPGTGDIWLAGQPNGTTIPFPGGGSDVAPAQSPVQVSLTLSPGGTLTFSATGTTGGAGCATPPTSPDGCGVVTTAGAAGLGLSGYSGPVALIGVFLDATTTPSGTGPATLPNNQTFATLSPLLNQVFFIGDGLTGTGSGTTQTFTVPAGAARLFLGSADGPGGNFNNTGSYSVTVTQAAAVPTMPQGLFAMLAALLVIATVYSLRRIA
jgi:hypothetical protein